MNKKCYLFNFLLITLLIVLFISISCKSNLKIKSDNADMDNNLLHFSGVGSIELGKRIPISILENHKDLSKAYFATYIADALIFEGFELTKPPVKVGLKTGPFHRFEKKNTSQKSSLEKLADEAVKEVTSSNKKSVVSMIVIESPEIKTEKGIGVGSTIEDMEMAYENVKINKVPPTFGNDLCSVHVPELKSVYFYFKSRKEAEQGGEVIRIILF